MKKLTMLLFCFCFINANAAIWRLNNNPGIDADFRTFTEAHEAASAGDTIFIEGNGYSNHYGNITISKKLIIIGPGYFLNENDSLSANQLPARISSIIIEATAAGTEIYGLYIASIGGSNNLVIKASDVIISRNYFTQDGYNDIILSANIQNVSITRNYGFKLETSSNSVIVSNIMVANNFFGDRVSLNSNTNGVMVNNVLKYGFAEVHNSQIKNNIIWDGALGNPLSQNNANNIIAYNLVAHSSLTGILGPGNITGVNMGEVFLGYPNIGTNSNDGRWQLKADGPAKGAGENGIDCGMFGGSSPYKLSGIAPVPIIYKAIIPTSGSTTGGLPVILNIKSQN